MKTKLPELAGELGTTDRTLRRALRQGMVRAHRPSPRAVELSVGERAYLRRTWPLLASLRQALRTEPAISLAVLFGSRARGDDHASSDVDLLVRVQRGSSSRAVASRLSEKLGLRVQIVLLEDAERAPRFLAEVMREGRVMIDRDEVWRSLLVGRRRIERAAARERRRIDDAFTKTFGLGQVA
ncbi:MAG: nucleotidyltransferase domain-containing protein [Gaiellaceae bacterium]